jgi:ferredoxin
MEQEEEIVTVAIAVCKTWTASIFMAGDIGTAKQVAREFCRTVGFCLSIRPERFIYTGGEESGFCVTVIQYPKFQQPEHELWDVTVFIADLIRDRCCQRSYTIISTDRTLWSDDSL